MFNLCVDDVVREVNDRVLAKVMELLSVTGGTFEINQLLLAENTTPVADSEEKLSRLVSEFGTVCQRRKLRVNECKTKIIMCSRYGNWVRMHARINGEPLEEVDGLKYLDSQVEGDRGCERDVVHRMNEG